MKWPKLMSATTHWRRLRLGSAHVPAHQQRSRYVVLLRQIRGLPCSYRGGQNPGKLRNTARFVVTHDLLQPLSPSCCAAWFSGSVKPSVERRNRSPAISGKLQMGYFDGALVPKKPLLSMRVKVASLFRQCTRGWCPAAEYVAVPAAISIQR